MRDETLKIAIQRSGRLSESSIELLRKAGIQFENGDGKLKSTAANFPLEILFVRDDDIPRYVEDGVADIGFVGRNVLGESCSDVRQVEPLGFGKCRLALAVPRSFRYGSVADLAGRRIATSYPKLLGAFLEQMGVEADIHELSGSVEIAPSIGLADAVCDLVSSGSTLFTNGLKEVETVMASEAVLISRRDLDEIRDRIFNSLLFRLRAVIAGRQNKYILLNAPNSRLTEIASILPGMKSPTILPLALEGWSSVHSVISDQDYWEVVEKLKLAGAEGILVISIDQMIR
jgi:ATP phosphoribosyltransferase